MALPLSLYVWQDRDMGGKPGSDKESQRGDSDRFREAMKAKKDPGERPPSQEKESETENTGEADDGEKE